MVADRETRIAARRARIAARLRAAKANQATDTPEESHEETLFNVVKSRGFAPTLLKAQLKEKVLSLKSLANDRTFNQLSLNITRYQDLDSLDNQEQEFLSTVEESTKSRGALSLVNVPQQLFQKQNALCGEYESMVDSKDKIIRGMYEELKLKDDEYSLAMKEEAQDVIDLLGEMGRQATLLRDFYLKELDNTENTLLAHRQALIDSNRAEMTVLIQERQDIEVKYHDDLQACKENFMKLLNYIREDDIEEFNALKIRLENDAQNLEQHLQTMQAVYQLNAEKLEYNFSVLAERELENYVMSNQQKKKITKQRDSLSNIKGRHHELEKKFTEHNERLTEDYLRVTRLLQELQRKEQNLQLIHAQIHRRFFLMHLRTISSFVSRVLQADKHIHEQELGWKWRLPSTNLFLRLGCGEPVKETNANLDQDKLVNETTPSRPLLESLADERYHFFMASLIKEAGFFIDKESTEPVTDLNPKLHQRAWCAIILNALGVHDSISLEKLFISLTNKMEENEAISATQLKSFVQGEKMSQDIISSHDEKKKHDPNPLLQLWGQRAKAMSTKLKWEGYWRSFTTIISPKVLCVWKHLESALFNYNQILKDRLFVSKEVISLRQRNQKLKETLSRCLTPKDS
ncbi:unnamed protein product [Calypogeia fissa]